MTHFRLYRLKADNRIINAIDIDVPDEAAAIARAIEIDHAPWIEVWRGTTMVARVAPNATKAT